MIVFFVDYQLRLMSASLPELFCVNHSLCARGGGRGKKKTGASMKDHKRWLSHSEADVNGWQNEYENVKWGKKSPKGFEGASGSHNMHSHTPLMNNLFILFPPRLGSHMRARVDKRVGETSLWRESAGLDGAPRLMQKQTVAETWRRRHGRVWASCLPSSFATALWNDRCFWFETTQADTLCQSAASSDQKERWSDLLSLSLRAVPSPHGTDLSRRLELVKATGGGRETGESEQRVTPTERGHVCVCGTARADKKWHFLVTWFT